MNQKNDLFQTDYSTGGYLAPLAKVLEIKAQMVVCTSPNSGDYPGLNNDDNPYGF